MYAGKRARFLRNVAAAAVNGIITLIILLIAPLGLLAVIINTILVTLSTYFVCFVADFVLFWSYGDEPQQMNQGKGMISREKWQQGQMTDRRDD